MYLLYVDESGDPGPAGSPYLVLGGAAIFEGKWLELERQLRGLVDHHFPIGPKPTEIHLADLRKGKKEFHSLTPVQRQSLLDDFCRLPTNFRGAELVMFSVVVDKSYWFANHPGKNGDDLYAEMFEDLSSRFDLFLQRQHSRQRRNKGIIIADPHKSSLSDALKANLQVHRAHGNRWMRLRNLVETVFFLPSNESPGIQLADLAAHSLWRLVTAGDASLASAIWSVFDREPFDSTRNPGKWHGIKYIGDDPTTRSRLNSVWPG